MESLQVLQPSIGPIGPIKNYWTNLDGLNLGEELEKFADFVLSDSSSSSSSCSSSSSSTIGSCDEFSDFEQQQQSPLDYDSSSSPSSSYWCYSSSASSSCSSSLASSPAPAPVQHPTSMQQQQPLQPFTLAEQQAPSVAFCLPSSPSENSFYFYSSPASSPSSEHSYNSLQHQTPIGGAVAGTSYSYPASSASSVSGESMRSSKITSGGSYSNRKRRNASAAERYRLKLKGRCYSLFGELEKEQERNRKLKARIQSKLALYSEFVELLAQNTSQNDVHLASLGRRSLSSVLNEVYSGRTSSQSNHHQEDYHQHDDSNRSEMQLKQQLACHLERFRQIEQQQQQQQTICYV